MSLEGCSGFEWNILECTPEELEQIKNFVKLVKELRGMLHTGSVKHADFKDPALRARGVVNGDATQAVWVVATVTNLRNVLTERLCPAGLDASRTYRVRLREEIGESRWGWNTPQWIAAARTGEGFVVSGALLQQIGLQLPPLWPMQAIVLDMQAL